MRRPSWRLTAALFQAIAAHDELLSPLAALPPDRLPALLASAAVSFLVRRDLPVPLAAYFPEPGSPQPRFEAGFTRRPGNSSRVTWTILRPCVPGAAIR